MYDAFHNEQYDLLYRLDEWHIHRTNQNIFLDYRSWSGIFQTISMFINQCDYTFSDVLFLTPVQIESVMMHRAGLWAETFQEYVYESFTIDSDFDEVIGRKEDFQNLQKIRENILYRFENQEKPKLVIILHAEQLSWRQIQDCNQYLKIQTMVCFDSAMFFPSNSVVKHIKKPLKHTFLNLEAPPIQQFLYQALDKQLVPISKEKTVKVHEYRSYKMDLEHMPKPVLSITENAPIGSSSNRLSGSLIYTTQPNWNYHLEENRYFLIKGMYLVIDTVSKRDNIERFSMHPTYSKYKFKVVPDVHYQRVETPALVDTLPPWKFSRGSIITEKTFTSRLDAARWYNAMNFFEDQVDIFII